MSQLGKELAMQASGAGFGSPAPHIKAKSGIEEDTHMGTQKGTHPTIVENNIREFACSPSWDYETRTSY